VSAEDNSENAAAAGPESTSAEKPPTEPPYLRERAQFRALILANPNYFGNVPVSPFEPVLQIQSDTTYERLGCVGFQPQFNRLDAVVFVTRPVGYGGGICTAGTPEYVRFFLSSDNGATWLDQGLTSFQAHDIPGTSDTARLEYAVSLQISPSKRFCFFPPNLARVRAILSWNVPPPPGNPDFTPVFGDVHDTSIQIEPFRLIILGELLKELKVDVPAALGEVVDLQQPAAAAVPKKLSALELQEAYKGKGVEPHRFALTQLNQLVQTSAAGESLMASGFAGALAGLKINLQEIIAKLFPTDGDTRYEQLECVGFNQDQNVLSGVIRVKLPNGYSGGLCTAGSQEYVTFWADVDGSGNFATCLGTTSVNVHDIPDLPKGGLEYSVFLPVDLSRYQRPCDAGPKLIRIRAILSWQVAPPCSNPDYVPVWGNREETQIQLLPGVGGARQVPFLSAVGDIPEIYINGNGIANGTAIHTGFVAVQSPFGGAITIAGHISNAGPGLKYRVMRKPHLAPDSSYVPLTDEPVGLGLIINTWDPMNGWVQTPTTVHADAEGYYPFEDFSANHSVEGNIMLRWFSTVAEDGLTFDLRIDLSVDGNPAHDVHSNVVSVLVDNTRPVALLDINLGGGVECADFDPGTTFIGNYTATDIHFKEFSFVIRPPGPANGVLPTPASGLSSAYLGGTIADPGVAGGTYALDTGRTPPVGEPHVGPMDPCGYSLTLQVWDRTNVDSGAGNNYNEASVGFCVRTPQPG
jgi:hypothetical protein